MMASQPQKVLITGASGFVATWIVKAILERGHHVRGTVRNNKKGEYLKNLFPDRFEYVIVEDIQKEDAFDDVVKGMDAIVHTASPFHYDAEDPQDLIGPAVQGTTSVLESTLKHAPDVKRVVITSSVAAVMPIPDPNTPPKVFSERNYNHQSTEVVKKEGKKAPGVVTYLASKTLAEISAWNFISKHQNEIGWDLVTIRPPYIFGPIIHQVASPDSMNTSSAMLFDLFKDKPSRSNEDLLEAQGSFVDVRDVAWAHAEALTNKKLANKDGKSAIEEGIGRVIVSAGPFTWQDVIDSLTDIDIGLPETTPRGEKGEGKKVVHRVLLDTSRARDVLGVKFRSMTETFSDCLEDFKKKGWI